MRAVFHLFFITMSSPEEQSLYKEPLSPIGRTQSGLAALIVTPSPKKTDGNGNRAVDDEPFIDKRKPLSTMAVIGVLSNGPNPKKTDGNGDQDIKDKIFINKRKPSSTMPVKGVLNYGEHTLIPVNLFLRQ
jgi:hypothetical protein